MAAPNMNIVCELAPYREPANFYWKIPKGDAQTARVKLLIAGKLIDLTSYSVTLIAKRSPYDTSPVFQKAGVIDVPATSILIQLVTGLLTPQDIALTLGTGTLSAGTYYYRVSAVNAIGETLASEELSFTIGIGDEPAGIDVAWGSVAGAASYNIFGREEGQEELLANVSIPYLTWHDDGTASPSGALPTKNSSIIEAGKYIATISFEDPSQGQVTLIGTVEIIDHA